MRGGKTFAKLRLVALKDRRVKLTQYFHGLSKEGDIIAWRVGEHMFGRWYGVCVGIVLELLRSWRQRNLDRLLSDGNCVSLMDNGSQD